MRLNPDFLISKSNRSAKRCELLSRLISNFRRRKEIRKKETSSFRSCHSKARGGNFTVRPRRRSTAISPNCPPAPIRPIRNSTYIARFRQCAKARADSADRCAGSEGRRENASGLEPEPGGGPTYEVIPRNKFLVRCWQLLWDAS